MTFQQLGGKLDSLEVADMALGKELRQKAWSRFIDSVVWIADKRPVMRFLVGKAENRLWGSIAVSYTHLTLPTKRIV